MKTERQIKEGGIKTAFNKLKSVVCCFSATELKTVRNYVVFEHSTQFTGKTVALFDFLVKRPECTLQEAIAHVGNISKAAFEMLVYRLKEKLCYALASEHIVNREGAVSDRFKAYCEGKDLLKQYYMLRYRGAQAEANDRLNQVITQAQKFEWYDTLTEAYHLKLEYLKVRSEKTMYHEIESGLAYAEFCSQATHKAKRIFDDIATINKSTASRNDFVQMHERALTQLKELVDKTQSATIAYQLFKVEIGYYQELEQYVTAEEKAQQLLALVSNTPAISQPHIIGIAFLYLADTLIYLGKQSEALTYSKLARKQFKPNSANYAQALELEFFASFYSGNYPAAEKTIRQLLDNPNYPVSDYLRSRRRYFLAYTLFAQEKYSEADIELALINAITQDKTGYNIGIRILSLLICRMQSDYELLKAREKAFINDIERVRKHKAIRKRDLLIFATIKELAKRNGSFDEVYERRKADFTLLRSNDAAYKWKAFSHELLNYSDWFIKMCRKKPQEQLQD